MKTLSVAAIGACIAVLLAAVVLRLGLGATSYDTLDGQGGRLGFNDPISRDHYRIIIGNFNPSALRNPERLYDLLLLVMQLTGIKLLLSRSAMNLQVRRSKACNGFTVEFSRSSSNLRLRRWFFGLQAFVFPLGLLGLLYFPMAAFHIAVGGMDREGFVDVPFIAIASQGAWLMVSTALWLSSILGEESALKPLRRVALP